MGDGFDYIDPLSVISQELATSVLYGGAGFCGVTQESFAIGGTTHHWRKGSKLKIAVDFDDLGQLTANQVKEAIEAAVNEVRAATDGLSFELFTPPMQSNLVCRLARLDGPNGVLADCGIPMPNASPDTTQLQMRIDTGEVWRLFSGSLNGAIDFQRVWLHEFEHFLGLGHKPASISKPALIAPMYSPMIRGLQAADIEELVRRYGGKTSPPAPIPPLPAPGAPAEIPVRLEFDAFGRTYSAKGAAKPKPLAFYVDRYPTGPIVSPPFVEQDEMADTDLYDEGDLT